MRLDKNEATTYGKVMRSGLLATLAGILFLVLGYAFQSGMLLQDHDSPLKISNAKKITIPGSIKIIGVNGKEEKLSAFKGQVVMINFWASWCGPCMQEMPDLYSLQKKYENRGFKIIAINLDDSLKEGVDSLKNKFGNPPFSIYQDQSGELQKLFSIPGVPYTVIVNKNLEAEFFGAGARQWLDKDWKKFIEGLL